MSPQGPSRDNDAVQAETYGDVMTAGDERVRFIPSQTVMGILIKPIITEKATLASERHNRYTFLVNTKANKVEIKKAVEAAYGVTVEKVRTLNYGPERKMRYTKTGIQKGQTNSTKKAIVQVADGNSIDFYSNL